MTNRFLARSALLRACLRRKERFSFVLNGTSKLVPTLVSRQDKLAWLR